MWNQRPWGNASLFSVRRGSGYRHLNTGKFEYGRPHVGPFVFRYQNARSGRTPRPENVEAVIIGSKEVIFDLTTWPTDHYQVIDCEMLEM